MNIRNITLFTLLSLLFACTADPSFKDVIVENGVKYSTFDYSTSQTIYTSISVGKKAFVSIYTEDPEANPMAEAIRTLWTDSEGYYECDLYIPSMLIGSKLYASVNGEVISAIATKNGIEFFMEADGKKTQSRSGELTYEDRFASLNPSIEYCKELRTNYQNKMPKGSGYQDNLSRLDQTDGLSIGMRYDNTLVLFTFLLSNGWNTNFMYYYYYKDNDPLSKETRKEVIQQFCKDKYLCSRGWKVQIKEKNGKDPNNDDVSLLTEDGNGGINCCFNRKIDVDGEVVTNALLFYGEDYNQKPSYYFPKGYKIGFILKSISSTVRTNTNYNDPNRNYIDSASDATDGNVHNVSNDANVYYYFSDPDSNDPDNTDEQNTIHAGRFWTANATDKDNHNTRFVYGFEDSMKDKDYPNNGCDRNFNDYIFLISTNPTAETDDVSSFTSTYETTAGTLLFEDMFPDQGDYDMNDVIVEYRIRKNMEQYSDDKSYIKDMFIDFAPVHYGATYDNYIYARCFTTDGDEILPIKAEFGQSLKSVCEYNRQQIESSTSPTLKTARVYFIRDYKINGKEETVLLEPGKVLFKDVDPFIFVRTTTREVHLTGKTNAGMGITIDLSDNEKLYRAKECKNGFFPWAMDIPIRSAGKNAPGFIPVTESIKICSEYLKFGLWVESNGTSDTDWYKYHTPVTSK